MIGGLVIGFGLLLLVLALYLIVVAYDAKHDVRTAPRTDMYICDRHGALPRKLLLNMTMLTGDPMPYCPLCFEDRIREANGKR